MTEHLVNFVIESNKIEGIGGYRDLDLHADEMFLALKFMHIDALRDVVWTIARRRSVAGSAPTSRLGPTCRRSAARRSRPRGPGFGPP
jgi:hypothetical protein